MKQLAAKEREKIEREESLKLRKEMIKTKQAQILCIDASVEWQDCTIVGSATIIPNGNAPQATRLSLFGRLAKAWCMAITWSS